MDGNLHRACAVLFALLCCASWAKEDSKRVTEKAPTTHSQPARQPERQQYPTENSPLPVRVIESPSDEADRKRREAKTDEHEDADLKAQIRSAEAAEKQILVGVASSVLTLLGLFALVWTLVETRRSATAATVAADAARMSANIARDAMVLTQRASVHPSRYFVNAEKDASGAVCAWRIGMQLENTGSTTATNFSAGCYLQFVKAGEPVDDFDFTASGPKVSLGPQRSIGTGGNGQKTGLSKDQAEQMLAGKLDCYLCGIARYCDVFDGTPERTTKVCMKLEAGDLSSTVPFGFTAHQEYNDAT